MWTPGVAELLIVFGLVAVFFGGKKIPEIAKGLGSGIKEFKKAKADVEVKEISESQVK